jgi:soluble lytic murein transglycosylase-like protein
MTSRTPSMLLATAVVLVGTSVSVHAGALDAVELQAARWRDEAVALEHGAGVTKDRGAAINLYCKAAQAGDRVARYNLGWMYANGRGTERNDAFAAYFFGLAAEQGDEPSRNMLAVVGPSTSKPPCVSQAEAEEASRLAAERAVAAEVISATALDQATNRYKRLIDTDQERSIMAIVQRLAPQYGIYPGLAFAVIRAESNFNPLAISEKNAQGLMQLIPATASRFRVKNPFDPEQNIRGGLSYLRWLLAYFKGDVPLVLAAYNAGEGAVERFKGVPPYPETQGYVRRIQEVFSLPDHPFDASVTEPSPELARFGNKPRS